MIDLEEPPLFGSATDITLKIRYPKIQFAINFV